MVLSLRVFAFLSAFLSFGVVNPAKAQDYVPGEVIVKLKGESSSPGAFGFLGKAQDKMELKQSFGKMGIYHFGLRKGQTVEEAVQELKNDPEVEYAEPNYILKKSTDDQVGISQTYTASEVQQYIQASSYESAGVDESVVEAWSFSSNTFSAQRPIVAVIDTGLDLTHQVFVDSNAVWTNPNEVPNNGIDDDGNGYVDDVHGWNFVSNSGTIIDDDDHGTHVSGIILSVDQDIYNAPFEQSKIQIMPLKFLDGNGSGSTSNAIKAIYYAVNNGATVLNNSWGGPSYSAALKEAIVYSYSKGVSFVVAAGNSGTNNDSAPMYPASYDVPNIISVAATHNSWSLTSFSNYGKASVHLGARGYFILSTIPGGYYGNSSGTSMAAPFVSGTAIQMKVQAPSMLGYQIKSIIMDDSVYESALQSKVYTDGHLDSSQAIYTSQTAPIETSQPQYVSSMSGNRELASNLAGGGGCGLVAKYMGDSHFGGRGPGGTLQSWYVILLLAILTAPIMLVTYMRRRNPANRRKHERFKVQSDVRIRFGDRELVGSVSSISLGGVQINTEALLEQGGIVSMAISSPDGKEQVQVEGKIVWSEANKAYGVAFSEAPKTALERISQWTSSLVKAS
ncbi:MAG: S8 family serine peptidase [Nitrospira sp.]|nr:S8 family serine peptidase [Nitrospira sp.]